MASLAKENLKKRKKLKRGKTRAIKSQLVFVLHMIGLEIGVRYLIKTNQREK